MLFAYLGYEDDFMIIDSHLHVPVFQNKAVISFCKKNKVIEQLWKHGEMLRPQVTGFSKSMSFSQK